MPTTNTYTSLTDEAGCDAYLASHIDPEGDYLYRLYRATNIHTIHGRMASGHEINDEMEDFTRPWIEGSPVADKIDFRIGDAAEEAPKLGIMFDMAFVDGDKRNYTEVYEKLLPIIRPGGYILADNTLWDWHVIDPAYDNDHQTIGIRHFNDFIAKDDRIEKVILPLRDGLTLIRKK